MKAHHVALVAGILIGIVISRMNVLGLGGGKRA